MLYESNMPPAVKKKPSPKDPKLSIPKKILALLSETPGELVLYSTLWQKCWNDGPYHYVYCIATLQANVALARKHHLGSDHIRNVRDYGYIYFES